MYDTLDIRSLRIIDFACLKLRTTRTNRSNSDDNENKEIGLKVKNYS